jgi:hypothetical protein
MRAKYKLPEEITPDNIESLEIESEHFVALINKSYSVKANLIKAYNKIRALAILSKYDTKEMDKKYENIKKSFLPKDRDIEDLMLELNIVIQQILVVSAFDIVRLKTGFMSVEKE